MAAYGRWKRERELKLLNGKGVFKSIDNNSVLPYHLLRILLVLFILCVLEKE